MGWWFLKIWSGLPGRPFLNWVQEMFWKVNVAAVMYIQYNGSLSIFDQNIQTNLTYFISCLIQHDVTSLKHTSHSYQLFMKIPETYCKWVFQLYCSWMYKVPTNSFNNLFSVNKVSLEVTQLIFLLISSFTKISHLYLFCITK